MNKKISIITINYNNLEGLKRTVESVVNQTWKEFEYIIIDGASTDGSAEYIESQKDKFDYWLSEKDSGIYNAMNKGIAKAKGEYLLFLNSGDHLFSNSVLEENNIDLFEEDLIYFNLNIVGETKSYIRKYTEKLLFSYLMSDTLPHLATFIKTSLFDKVGLYDESLKIVSDWKFFIVSICQYNCSYKRIEKTLSTFYLDGISSQPQIKQLIAQERNLVLLMNFSSFLCDYNEYNDLKKAVSNFKKSKKIKVLIKLGLLNKL